jgi:hypothetical protein
VKFEILLRGRVQWEQRETAGSLNDGDAWKIRQFSSRSALTVKSETFELSQTIFQLFPSTTAKKFHNFPPLMEISLT